MDTERKGNDRQISLDSREKFNVRKSPQVIANEYLSNLPLTDGVGGIGTKPLTDAIKYIQKTGQGLVIVSTVCPSYSTNESGTPDYRDLETGISPNTQSHFAYLPNANRALEESGVDFVHFFLMADTEVDLLPFLSILDITPEEFTTRCQASVNQISEKVIGAYGNQAYEKFGVPPAARFLDYFGHDNWFQRYEKFLGRLLYEREADPYGKVSRALEYDYSERSILIRRLLGAKITREDGIKHIARQKAQYMAFASLMRERFGRRLIVVNHRTPNFAWMNDKITREPDNPVDLENGNYLHQLPLIELDISTLPEN